MADEKTFENYLNDSTANVSPANADKLASIDASTTAGSKFKHITLLALYTWIKNQLDNVYSTFSGSYNDLSDKPTFDGSYSSLSNKPALFDGDYSSLSSVPSTFTPNVSSIFNKISFSGITEVTPVAGVYTINWGASNHFIILLTEDASITFADQTIGYCQLIVQQDNTGSWAVTFNDTILSPEATGYIPTTTANAIDMLTFFYDGTDIYLLDTLKNFSAI